MLTRLGGALFERARQPVSIGEIAAGIVLLPLAALPSRRHVGEDGYDSVKASMEDLTNGLLGPLFFASLGVRLDLGAVTAVPVFLGLLLVVAFLGKLIGSGVPTRLAGFRRGRRRPSGSA